MPGVKELIRIDPLVVPDLESDVWNSGKVKPTLSALVVGETGKFLYLCAAAPEGEVVRPSQMVDVGWHAFILRTRAYQDHCKRLGVEYIHHDPDSVDLGSDEKAGGVENTLRIMRDLGVEPEMRAWQDFEDDFAACSQCGA